jgi:DNA-binding response OmpR family regulator
MKQNPVIVFVSSKERAEEFKTVSGFQVFAAPTMRDALAQTIFSYPDAVIIDAAYDMVLADDSYYHLRTIEHPPLIILSDASLRWERRGGGMVVILPESSDDETLVEAIQTLNEENTALPL